MKTKSGKVLPKTVIEIQNGGIYIQRVRCGKSNCNCARGETHTAFYFFARRNGKLVKTYIRKADVESFSEIVNQATAQRTHKRRSVKQSNELLKHLRESVREYEQITKLHKQNYNYEQS
jgi:hypothetical protein